jgi:hypothetical protein
MTRIEMTNEQEGSGGWTFDAHIARADAAARRCRLSLSFADYNLWSSSGTDAPSQVARAVVAFMLEKLQPEAMPTSFDASIARRKFSDADVAIPKLIRG